MSAWRRGMPPQPRACWPSQCQLMRTQRSSWSVGGTLSCHVAQPLCRYGGGQHEATVQLTDKAGKPAGHLHLGLLLVKEGAPGEEIGEPVGGSPDRTIRMVRGMRHASGQRAASKLLYFLVPGHPHAAAPHMAMPSCAWRAGSAAGTVLGSVPGGGPASPSAAAMPGPMLPSTATAEMQVRA